MRREDHWDAQIPGLCVLQFSTTCDEERLLTRILSMLESIVSHQIHEVGRVRPVKNAKGRIQADRMCMEPE